jgi:hypothetical protein
MDSATPLIKGDKIIFDLRQRETKMSIACMNMTVNTKLIKPLWAQSRQDNT